MRSLIGYSIALAASIFVSVPLVARADVVITVDESTQRMLVTIDGAATYDWRVSTGGPGYDTPTGTFRPFRMERDHFSQEWDDAPMPYSIFFTPEGHAIHGSEHTRLLGRAASHGCVRLDPRNAAILYQLVTDEGLSKTEVVITRGNSNVIDLSDARAADDQLIPLAPLPMPMAQSEAQVGLGQLY